MTKQEQVIVHARKLCEFIHSKGLLHMNAIDLFPYTQDLELALIEMDNPELVLLAGIPL